MSSAMKVTKFAESAAVTLAKGSRNLFRTMITNSFVIAKGNPMIVFVNAKRNFYDNGFGRIGGEHQTEHICGAHGREKLAFSRNL